MDTVNLSSHSESVLKPATYCLFLGDLSLFCNEDDISATFSQFGQLADVRIKRNKTTKRNLSYGFVEYVSMDSAVTAMNEMNGKVFCGRALRIRWASTLDTPKLPKPRSEMGKVEDTKSVSIYLAFNSTVPNLMINDESLRVLFGVFGAIEDVSIKQSVIDRQTLCQRGYAFVCFMPDESGIQAAVNASAQMGDCIVDGVHYRCEISKSLKGIIEPHAAAAPPRYASNNRYHQETSGSHFGIPPYNHESQPRRQPLDAYPRAPHHSHGPISSNQSLNNWPSGLRGASNHSGLTNTSDGGFPRPPSNYTPNQSPYWPTSSHQSYPEGLSGMDSSSTYPPSALSAPSFPSGAATYPSAYQVVPPSASSHPLAHGTYLSPPQSFHPSSALPPPSFSGFSAQPSQKLPDMGPDVYNSGPSNFRF